MKIKRAHFCRYWFKIIPECHCIKIQPWSLIITLYYPSFKTLKNLIMKIIILLSMLLLFISASCQDYQDTLVYVTVEDYDSLANLQMKTAQERDSLQELLDFQRSLEIVLNIPDSIRTDTFHTIIYNDDLSIYVNVLNDRGVVRVIDKTDPIRFFLDYTSVRKWDFVIYDSTQTLFNPGLNLEKLTGY